MNLVLMLSRAVGLALIGGFMLLVFSAMTSSPSPPTAEAQDGCFYEQRLVNGRWQWVKQCPAQMRAYPARRMQSMPVVIVPRMPVIPQPPIQPELQDTQVIDTWESPPVVIAAPATNATPPATAAPAAATAAPAATPQAPAVASAASGGSTGTVKAASGGSTGTIRSASGGSTGSIKSGGSTGSQAYGSYSTPVQSYATSSYGSTGSQAGYAMQPAVTYTYSEPFYGNTFAGPAYASAACDCPDCNCVDCNCGGSMSAAAYAYDSSPVDYVAVDPGNVYGTRPRGFARFFAGIRGASSRFWR